ncbi:MAG: hypothetical protein A3G23_08890 [Bacteroidetes bacterium RIFCSPLOWO2_12_FULL_37_12]|nr:MAG: hypothetical protein A3G23_08890 [Bacteroidetes bacterium RIFCSPLOWO2_12_FULL_37_12]
MGQDAPKKDEAVVPEKNTFEDLTVINNVSMETLNKKALSFSIQHRFGNVNEGFKKDQNFDLLGIFAPANVRLGLDFGITDRFMLGIGGTKNNYLYDLEWKYRIIRQGTKGGSPLSVTYYGLGARNSKLDDKFKTFSSRLSFFHQLIMARKITKKLSLQIAASVSHFNLVDSLMNNDNYSYHFAGRYQFSPQSSILLEYNAPITKAKLFETKPDLAFGWEIATRGHSFQIFLCTANSIVKQYDNTYNVNDFSKGEMMIGFNISRRWKF